MRLNCFLLPLIIFAVFSYGVLKLNDASDNDTKLVTGAALKASVQQDINNVKALAKKAVQ